MSWPYKDLLGTKELSREEILLILNTAESFKEISRRDIKKGPDAPRKDSHHCLLRTEHEDTRLLRDCGQKR